MPVNPTYPGVYIEEIPSGVRTITGVSTSITAFLGRALRGEVDEPTLVHSFADFERVFGKPDCLAKPFLHSPALLLIELWIELPQVVGRFDGWEIILDGTHAHQRVG